MKKLIFIFILIPTFLFASDVAQDYKYTYRCLDNYQVESFTEFNIKAFHFYELKVKLKSNTQYCFILSGIDSFHVQFIEPSGNKWGMHDSENNRMIIFENIMDKGEYIIWVYSNTNNRLKLFYGEY